MDIEKKIFKRACFDYNKLENFGFHKKGNMYFYTQDFLNGDFKCVVKIEDDIITGKVLDVVNDEEEYLPIRLEYIESSFVNKVKNSYEEILINIREKCTNPKYFSFEQANRITDIIYKKWNVKPDFPWANDKTYKDAAVFRNSNTQKWFGLVMNIDKSKIDKNLKGEVEILNMKIDIEQNKKLIQNESFFPAYHMNKKKWITVLLNDSVEDELIMKLLQESYNYSIKK